MSNGKKQQGLIEYLSEFVTDERLNRIEEVLNARTRKITVLLEDLYQPHNASAVLRSCDAFGIQDVHIVETINSFRVSKGVTIGTEQWLTLHRYQGEQEGNMVQCARGLKEKGYKLIATTPHEEDQTIDRLSVDEPLALMFGAELEGLSDKALKQADGFVKIPMSGFVESFNISVSAAICLYEVTRRLRAERNDWRLNEEERKALELQWIRQSVRRPDLLEKEFYRRNRGPRTADR